MAKSVVKNYTDTPINGVTSLTLPISVVNFGKDFRVKSDEPGEAILTNLTSPIDRPEKFRFAMSDIKDIYKNSGIDANLYSPSRRGVSVLVQLTDTYTVSDSTDTKYDVALPMEAHLVIKVPSNELITSQMIQDFVGRLTNGLFESGAVNTNRIKSLFRGSLIPTDL